MYEMNITGLQDAKWTREWDTSINPVEASSYGFVQTPNGLLLQMFQNDGSYGGWLCKNSTDFPWDAPYVSLHHTLMIDDATPFSGHVVETDSRVTASDGWTYLGDVQLNISNGWEIEYGAPWIPSGIYIVPPVPNVPYSFAWHWFLDYKAKKTILLSVDAGDMNYLIGVELGASQMNWAPKEIVTQYQQCSNGKPGGYSLRFNGVRYHLHS